MTYAVLLHGGTTTRRSALAAGIRAAAGIAVRVRVSSRAAEAAKCLADPHVIAVFLVDQPTDGDAVRVAAAQRGLSSQVYTLDARDESPVVVALIRSAMPIG